MKKVVLTVGPMGSGKTTACQQTLPNFYRISQDDQGKEGHKEAYKAALKTKDLIVVDRINHTKQAREFYLKQAKEAGFETEIIVFQNSFQESYDRITARKNHPTIKEGDKKVAIQALRMFYSQYQKPSNTEADLVTFLGEEHGYMLDISKECQNKRVILVGDLHGCFDEFQELLTKVSFTNNDVLILTGDLIDRGPKIKECLDFVRKTPNAYTIMSNHEDKLLRYLVGNKVNTTALTKTIEQCKEYMDEDFTAWLHNLPLIIKFDPKSYVVHAGINPNFTMDRQYREFLLYARNFNPLTNSFSDKDSEPWYTFPNQGERVFFGHNPLEETFVSSYAVALDGGCVFGDTLKAFIRNVDGSEEVLTIKAHKAYCNKIEAAKEAAIAIERYNANK